MGYKNSVLKFAHKYPLAVLVLGPVGIMMLFNRIGPNNISGLGEVFRDSGTNMDTLFNQTGKTGPTPPGTGRWDSIDPEVPPPSGPQVRYDLDYHTQAWITEPKFEESARERPVVQPGSVRHGYDPLVFAGLKGAHKL